MATPHVTGVCSLFHEWGIVQNNDPFLYSQKLKSLLLQNAKRDENQSYPNNYSGYGLLDLSNINLKLSNNEEQPQYVFNELYRQKGYISAVNVNHNLDFENELKEKNLNFNMIKISDILSVVFTDGGIDEINSLYSLSSVSSLV